VAIRYNKCPRYGSLNVIKIIYGMPIHDAFLMVEGGKIKLNGCCITVQIQNITARIVKMNRISRHLLTRPIMR